MKSRQLRKRNAGAIELDIRAELSRLVTTRYIINVSPPRDGRLLRGIRYAASGKDVEVVTTSRLLEWTYAGHRIRGGKNKSWHREMIRRAARKVAIPLGRSPTGRGRPMMWKVDPERISLRSPMERLRRKRERSRKD